MSAYEFIDHTYDVLVVGAGNSGAEIAHDVFQAWLTFPLFDVARRANRSRKPICKRRRVMTFLRGR